jgi:hypothetical protein
MSGHAMASLSVACYRDDHSDAFEEENGARESANESGGRWMHVQR